MSAVRDREFRKEKAKAAEGEQQKEKNPKKIMKINDNITNVC